MANYDELEREVVDLFKRQFISSSDGSGADEIYDLMVEHMYGKGVRDPMIPVDWDKVFSENRCPECGDIISLKESAYVCGKCALTIPLSVYDPSAAAHKRQMLLLGEEKSLREKMQKAGYSNHRIRMLYNAAVEEAMAELEEKDKQTSAAEDKGASGRTGAVIGGKREGDEKA